MSLETEITRSFQVSLQLLLSFSKYEEDVHLLSFRVRHPGPKIMPAANFTQIVYFLLFLTLEILSKIVTETKKYAEQVLGA